MTLADALQAQVAPTTRVVANEPMAKHTSFRIGGPAEAYVQVKSVSELIDVVRAARKLAVPHLLFGAGSNLLVLDSGVQGLVIEVRARGVSRSVDGKTVTVIAEAGAPLAALGRKLAKDGWSGLEWAIDVPGTCGGAVVNNAGANGGCVADSLISADVLDLDGSERRYSKADLTFDYRRSALKILDPMQPRPVVLRAVFRCFRGDPLSLTASAAQYSAYRKATQPVGSSAGSMFKNPAEHAAGWYIDQAGLKGSQYGKARISDLHGNFMLNLGGATSDDVLHLVRHAQSTILAQFGVQLELEIQVVGTNR